MLWSVKRTFDPIDASSDIALRCTSLSKTYYGKRRWYWPFVFKTGPNLAVNSLDLEVKKGSVTFLLGPNGGGKTTTLKCVAGMIPMDAGSRLEINEAGTVFGICPQQNVSSNGAPNVPTNSYRYFGRISLSKSMSISGENSRLPHLKTLLMKMVMTMSLANAT